MFLQALSSFLFVQYFNVNAFSVVKPVLPSLSVVPMAYHNLIAR